MQKRQLNFPGVYPATSGLILLLVGIVGLILSILYWSPLDSPGPWSRRRPHSNQAAGGPSYYLPLDRSDRDQMPSAG